MFLRLDFGRNRKFQGFFKEYSQDILGDFLV